VYYTTPYIRRLRCINPFGKPYAMAKDMLKAFLDRYEEWAKEEGIETPS